MLSGSCWRLEHLRRSRRVRRLSWQMLSAGSSVLEAAAHAQVQAGEACELADAVRQMLELAAPASSVPG